MPIELKGLTPPMDVGFSASSDSGIHISFYKHVRGSTRYDDELIRSLLELALGTPFCCARVSGKKLSISWYDPRHERTFGFWFPVVPQVGPRR